MNSPQPSVSDIDIEQPSYSRWSYSTSNTRSERIPIHSSTSKKAMQRSQPLAAHRPPLISVGSPGVQTSLGVWETDDDVYYTAEWPPVQEYLDLIRKEKKRVKAPSEIVFALAALHVVRTPSDVAHWIFWDPERYYHTADRVSAIALEKEPLIKTPVSWNGSREWKWIVNAYQEKFYYTHVKKRHYPVDYQPVETKKRSLRSTGIPDEPREMTVQEFFNIVDDDVRPAKKQRKSARKVEPQTSPSAKRARLPPAEKKSGLAMLAEAVEAQNRAPDAEPASEEPSPPVPRSSTRTKRKISPSTRTPRILSAPIITSPTPVADSAPSSPSDPLPSSSSHSRIRSISQSSVDTIVVSSPDQGRASSVDSADTAVGSSPSKKRKAEVLVEQVLDDTEEVPATKPAGRMTTRRSAKKARAIEEASSGDSELSLSMPSTRTSTPAAESRPKSTRPKARSRKAKARA